jgi:hypothetical protein
MLVVDVSTYDYYEQQQKIIHRGLPNVIIMPTNCAVEKFEVKP